MARTEELFAPMPKVRTAEKTVLAIVNAAEGLFAQKGYAAVAVGEVAKAVGVSQGLIYHHFASKRALWDAVFARINAAYVAGLDVPGSVSADEDPWALLKYRLRYSMLFLLHNPRYPRLRAWDRLQGMGTVANLAQVHIREVTHSLEALQQRGLARTDKDAQAFSQALYIWVAGFADQLICTETPPCDEQGAADYLEMIVLSLQRAPAA